LPVIGYRFKRAKDQGLREKMRRAEDEKLEEVSGKP